MCIEDPGRAEIRPAAWLLFIQLPFSLDAKYQSGKCLYLENGKQLRSRKVVATEFARDITCSGEKIITHKHKVKERIRIDVGPESARDAHSRQSFMLQHSCLFLVKDRTNSSYP